MSCLFYQFAAAYACELRENANIVFFDGVTEREAIRHFPEHSHRDRLSSPPAHNT